MGALSEILDTLGYGEQEGEIITQSINSNVKINRQKCDTNNAFPKSSMTNGGCVGCELSARYF